MGLDMYLYKRTYIGNNYRDLEHQITITIPKDEGSALYKGAAALIDSSKINEIQESAAYWRKANAIHHWFVNNVQDGEDDCRDYWVPIEKLQELYDLCKTVLKESKTDKPIPKDTKNWSAWDDITVLNHEDIGELLPPVGGFFFGSTEIGGSYLYDVLQTIEQIEPYLEKNEEGKYKYAIADFQYQSSW